MAGGLMGWWETDDGDVIGDPPLDILMDFKQAQSWATHADVPAKVLAAIATEYREGLGRPPVDSEINACLAYNRD